MKFFCLVCGWPGLRHDPKEQEHDICPSCGTQFGYSDSGRSYEELREQWARCGYAWQSEVVRKPDGWNPQEQLDKYLGENR